MGVRIYLSAAKGDIADLLAQGRTVFESGWALTPELISELRTELETDDLEVLEDQLCQWAGDRAGVAVVALAQAEVLDSSSGLIRPLETVSRNQIQAVFVRDTDEELVWFGPTELESALELANETCWHSN